MSNLDLVDGMGSCEEHGTTWDVVQGCTGCPQCGEAPMPDKPNELNTPWKVEEFSVEETIDSYESVVITKYRIVSAVGFEIAVCSAKAEANAIVLAVNGVEGYEYMRTVLTTEIDTLTAQLKIAKEALKRCREWGEDACDCGVCVHCIHQV